MTQENSFEPEQTGLEALFYHDHKLGQLIQQYEIYIDGNTKLTDDEVAKLLEDMNHHGAWDYHTSVQLMIGKLKLESLLQKKIKHLSG